MTPVVVFVFVVGASMWRDRAYFRLPVADRRRVDRAVRHGRPTAVATLDSIAVDRLARAARNAGSDRVARTILAAAFVAVPVVAAVRVSLWFLVVLLLSAFFAVQTFRQFHREDPRTRLARWVGTDEAETG